jgi:pimeloyl-ACP methyl ester carboxylesterase
LSNAQARWHRAPAWGGAPLRSLALSNPRMVSVALAEVMLGSAFLDGSTLQWHLRIWREGVTAEMGVKLMAEHLHKMDLQDLLPKVSVPTLVVHYRNDQAIPFESGRELAAGIPGARFVSLEGDGHIF